MKFVSLRTKRAHQQPGFDKAAHGHFATAPATHQQIQSCNELQQQIHNDLRVQHPDWVQADGKSPMCDSYEARLTQLLESVTQRASQKSIVDPHRLLEQGAH